MSIVAVVFAWWGWCNISLWKKTVAIIEGQAFSEMQWQSSEWWEQQEGWQQQQQLCLPQGNSKRQLFQPPLRVLLVDLGGGQLNDYCNYRHFLSCPQISKVETAERWVFSTLWREKGYGTHEHSVGPWLSGRHGNDNQDVRVHQLLYKVQKMLCGKHGMRLAFLRQRSHPNLPEEEVGLRKDIAREWNHIYETVSLLITFPFLPYMFDGILFINRW